MRYIATLFRFAVAFFAIAGTYKTWGLGHANYLVYFTHQTNFLIAFVFLWAAFASLLKGVQPPAWLKGMVTLNIIITGLVSWLVLPPDDPAKQIYILGIATNTMLHVIVPILTSVDFLVFDEHRRYKWTYAASWLGYFPIYLAFVLIRAYMYPGSGPADDGSPYPYGFINLDKLGLEKFVINCAMYLAIFAVLALIIVTIDKALPARTLLTGSARDAAHSMRARR